MSVKKIKFVGLCNRCGSYFWTESGDLPDVCGACCTLKSVSYYKKGSEKGKKLLADLKEAGIKL